jgi:hypothetical protein
MAVTLMLRLLVVVHLLRHTLGTQTVSSSPSYSQKIGPRGWLRTHRRELAWFAA